MDPLMAATRTATPIDYAIDQDGGLATTARSESVVAWIGYLAAGTILGIIFMKSEVLSWYRIQEMFRFQSIHMYGVIGVAVVTAALTRMAILRFGAQSLAGQRIDVPAKVMTPRGTRY
jgi:hypothetical protein